MTCCTCGASAGQWKQHWNRDTGFGLCAACARWLRDDKRMPAAEMLSLYGTPGVNYEDPGPAVKP